MSLITTLLSLPDGQLAGSAHTLREIAQQPDVWMRVLGLMEARSRETSVFMRRAGALGRGDAAILLAGAGSSDFIGRSIAPTLGRRLARDAAAVATTRLVTHPDSGGSGRRPSLVVHFARSGDSPESLATYRLLSRSGSRMRHMVITCNEAGALRREADRGRNGFVVTLPPETNDRSLAMTSSFTSMTLAGLSLGWLDAWDELRRSTEGAAAAARGILESQADGIAAFASRTFTRACYLGSDCLEGAMNEGALKMQEMTAGQVVSCSNSFLGVRHGPQVFIDGQCIVVACLSSAPKVRRYETDLLEELRGKRQGAGVLAITSREDRELARLADLVVNLDQGGRGVPDELRPLTDVVVCQLLAFVASRNRGLAPDNPSGIINRVVQGVTIYDD